jgi:hypothetical protein
MTIENLIKAVPPPLTPIEAFKGPWDEVEAELGTALPPDYKDFVRLYGSGYFMQFLGVAVPRSRNPNTRLESHVPGVSESFRGFITFEDVSYAVWPTPGGLVPFGTTDNGDDLFWLSNGAPSEWRVVVFGRGLLRFEAFDCDLTDFLAGLATGAILPEDFPGDLLPCDRLFQPHTRYLHYRLSWRVTPGGTMGPR